MRGGDCNDMLAFIAGWAAIGFQSEVLMSNRVASFVILAQALCGCMAAEVSEEAFAAGVASSALETTHKQQFDREIALGLDDACAGLKAEDIAKAVAQAPSVGLFPAGCVTKAADGAKVVVDYNDCTGPFGRVKLSGGIDATFSVSTECAVRAELSDRGDLTTNGKPLEYEAAGDITIRTGARDIDWNARWAGTTDGGEPIEQSSELVVSLDVGTHCMSAAGSASGSVDGHDYSWEATDYRVCPGECPRSGEFVATLEGRRRERTLTVRFDGTNVARVTGWTGREFDVELVCQAAK